MDAVLEELNVFLAKAKVYAEKIDSEIADRENDFRSMCFWNVYNRAVLTKEVVTFYNTTWKSMDIPVDLGPEFTERIVTVTRDMFVDTVSSIEKAAKDSVKAYKRSMLREKSMEGRNYLYLRNIIAASAEMSYISKEDFQEWEDILVMRNLVTHNNSVADRSKVFEINGLKLSMRPNRMMKGPPVTFVKLTSRVLDLFFEWLMTIDEAFS
ncbi:MAG: hypothetical protein J6K69_02815 [Candidatus Methanomethylophilaceae archaeon]|nr:hypothetical protein [Candidatus Methanomethylophilaceae archaeon]MBR2347759.1 hypothetical protein [Candidatus Methanomethylophilaceae archaeon]